jgi:hypothetical protein
MPAAYHRFLTRNAVQYVAVPDVPLTRAGAREAAFVASGSPYLRAVWRGVHWTLYVVRDAAPIVAAPGRLVSTGAATLTVYVPGPADVDLEVGWSRWLTVSGPGGPCLVRGQGTTTALRVHEAGTYTVSSALLAGSSRS